MTAEWVTAVATALLALLTLGAVLVGASAAWFAKGAIDSAREENRKWNTLKICAEFELNSCIAEANKELAEVCSGNIPDKKGCMALRSAAMAILNYLDGIAIGVKQGLYIESLAKDHLSTVVATRVDVLLHTSFAEKAGISETWWPHLIAMANKWIKNETYFDANRRGN